MKLYPVVMCGGAGTRLWPASRPSRPKQFIALSGSRSLFQDTVARVAPLAQGGGRLIVVAGLSHHAAIVRQLADLGVEALVLLEPAARDSAAAMGAAAAWTRRRDPSGINVFVASDHHIPDDEAFRASVTLAASEAALGRIVTLGVKPSEPSEAYGYIAPAPVGLSGGVPAVERFVEKPTRATAAHYIEDGYLWNSGNFVVSAETLLEELGENAADVRDAVLAALPPGDDEDVVVLGEAFLSAPKISIDYAVMEKSHRVSVLPVAFAWSDLGAWDAVSATGLGGAGVAILQDAENCLVRAPEGVLVALMGVRDIAVVVEPDAVLVCAMDRSQEVKALVERVRAVSPAHLDFEAASGEGLAASGSRFTRWLRLNALPVWSTLGLGEDGAFHETLSKDGRASLVARRARVQARQIQVYAEAGRLGWTGPWRKILKSAIGSMFAAQIRPDGMIRAVVGREGHVIDDSAAFYDQAFLIFALASAQASEPSGDFEAHAAHVRDGLMAQRPSHGGLIEVGDQPFQSNPHMHFLEASLAWETRGGKGWSEAADWIVSVAKSVFIDSEGGFLREFFGPDWAPAAGEDGRLVEPGHQFEWAWLMARHGRARGDASSIETARRLFTFGVRGVDSVREVAVDALNEDGTFRSRRARLWPQTEWLKASLILAELSEGDERASYLDHAEKALRALWRYLTPEGLWCDKLMAHGTFVDEAAPASSFYHIMAAWAQLSATAEALSIDLEGL